MSTSNESFTGPLIRSANVCNLFRKLSVRTSSPDTGEEADLKNELEALLVYGYDGPVAAGDYGALTRLLKSYSNVQLDLYRTNNFDQQLFCQGLAENNGLQKLRLDFQNGIVSDEVISNIILSLRNHLKLGALDIYTNDQFGDLSSQAMKTLLEDSSSLTNLNLSDS